MSASPSHEATNPEWVLSAFLDPQTDAERMIVTYLTTTLEAQGRETLAAMVHRAVLGAMRVGGATGREECLHAVQAVIDEVAAGARRREGGGE